MATIERKPLPPPNSRITTIAEADRAEIIAQAKNVMDYYLNGAGSYFDGGTQKPLVSEFGNSTVDDFKNFMGSIIASKQFSDDPNSIMDSVVELMRKAIAHIEQSARDNEGRDSISRPPPDTNDPIDDPRVISPQALGNGVLSISLPVEGGELALAPEARGMAAISGGKPARILSRRISEKLPVDAFDADAPAASNRQNPFQNGTSSPAGITPRNPNLPLPLAETGRPLGIFSGESMPLWTTPPPIWGSSNLSEAPGAGRWSTAPVGFGANRKSHAPTVDTRGAVIPLAPSDDSTPMGGLAGRIAALSGIDPDHPDQPVPTLGGLLALLLAVRR